MLSGTPKFFASTSLGVCANQSVIRKVESSEKFPSSNTSRNSQPSSGPSSPWIEWGIPPGKYQRSPSPTSSMKVRPSWSTAVMRARPFSTAIASSNILRVASFRSPADRAFATGTRSVIRFSSKVMWISSRRWPAISSVAIRSTLPTPWVG